MFFEGFDNYAFLKSVTKCEVYVPRNILAFNFVKARDSEMNN